MMRWSGVRCLWLAGIVLLVSACGGGDGNESRAPQAAPPGNTDLANLTLSVAPLDQVFQASNKDYTATVGFLATSTTVTPNVDEANATVTVNGALVASGEASGAIPLEEGNTSIQVVVTAADGNTTQTYSVTVIRLSIDSFSQEVFLKASNAEKLDQFGGALSLWDDTLAVGAPLEDSSAAGGESDNSEFSAGAVYIFTRTNGMWSQQAYLKASNADGTDEEFFLPLDGDRFGSAVALEGNTLVVGAPFEDSSIAGGEADNSAPMSGAVYVFTRINGIWSQQAFLKASNAEESSGFGVSLALYGDTLVVGGGGAVHVFTRSNGTWSQQAVLKTSNPEIYAGLGRSLALYGDTLAAGALNPEAVHVFTRNNGTWSQEAVLEASNGEAIDWFGDSVSLWRDTLAVGAPFEDSSATGGELDNSEPSAGAVYIFTRRDGVWSQQAYLKASNADGDERTGGDEFGGAIAVRGNTLIVGARWEDSSVTGGEADNSLSSSGAVYLFSRSDDLWSQRALLKASNAGRADNFGTAVSLWRDSLAVGAQTQDSSGAAYVFR